MVEAPEKAVLGQMLGGKTMRMVGGCAQDLLVRELSLSSQAYGHSFSTPAPKPAKDCDSFKDRHIYILMAHNTLL